MFFWQNMLQSNPTPCCAACAAGIQSNPAGRPKPGQKIQLRIGWKEPDGRGSEMWRVCTVDREDPTRCVGSRGADYGLGGVPRWKKGDEEKTGRKWRPR